MNKYELSFFIKFFITFMILITLGIDILSILGFIGLIYLCIFSPQNFATLAASISANIIECSVIGLLLILIFVYSIRLIKVLISVCREKVKYLEINHSKRELLLKTKSKETIIIPFKNVKKIFIKELTLSRADIICHMFCDHQGYINIETTNNVNYGFTITGVYSFYKDCKSFF